MSKTNLRVYKVNRNSLGYETELTEYTAAKHFPFILASTTAFPGLWHQVSPLKKLKLEQGVHFTVDVSETGEQYVRFYI